MTVKDDFQSHVCAGREVERSKPTKATSCQVAQSSRLYQKLHTAF